MTLLLEYREKIKQFYRLNSVVILPVLKFLVAFLALNGVNTMLGYMPKLDNIAIVLIASLACSFLPAGFLTLLCAIFSLAHLYSLSLEALIMALCVYLVLFLMLFRFAAKDSYVVVLTPLLFALKIPYAMPIVMGLVGDPISAVSVACGVIIYYLLTMVVGCAPTLRTMEDLADKLRYLIENLLRNKSALVVAASFAVTVVVVYLIRRMSVEYAWTIAIVAGTMVNLLILLVGNLLYDINLTVSSAIVGSILAILIAKVNEFFRFCVDYSRTERVQFEDDEYYYYVKAVPKMNVSAATKTVKKINTQSGVSVGSAAVARPAASPRNTEPSGPVTRTRTSADYGREPVRPGSQRPSQTGTRTASRSVRGNYTTTRTGANMSSGGGSYGADTRSMTTERTVRPAGNAGTAQHRPRPGYSSNQGMTVRSSQMTEDSDDYEELF